MKKAEFIQIVAEKSALTKKDTNKAVDAVLEVITEALVAGKDVSFLGFGTFSTANRAARKSRVPGTDRIVDIPAQRLARFKVGKSLKTAVASSAK